MSFRDDASDTVLQNVLARVDEALCVRLQSGRSMSSIGSGGSHCTEGLYVAVAEVPAVRCTNSRGTLPSSRLQGTRSTPAPGAAGVIRGLWIKVIDSRANEAVSVSCR